MKYAVIICPKCGKAKGVEAGKKTTSCPCGREMTVARLKFYFETDSPSELARAVAEANEQLAEGKKPSARRRTKHKDPYARISERARVIKDPLERMHAVAKDLTSLQGEFGCEDLRRIAHLVGKVSPEDMIARLQEQNLIYEVTDGRYRSV
jgi:transposase